MQQDRGGNTERDREKQLSFGTIKAKSSVNAQAGLNLVCYKALKAQAIKESETMSWRGCGLSTCRIPAKLPLADSELEFCILAFHAWLVQFFCWHDDCCKGELSTGY